MRSLWLIFTILVIFTVAVKESFGNEIPSSGDGIDPETAELLDRFVKARRISPFGYTGGLPWLASRQQKRNSELINSILGLPKVMNDAGRRK